MTSIEILTPVHSGKTPATALSNVVPDGTPISDLFTALINSAPIGIYIVQGGEFQFVSRKFTEILGYSQSELTGSEAIRYVYPEDRDMVKNCAKEALKNGYCNSYEYRINTKSGDLKWVMETVISVNYHGRRATLGNFMDITDDKKAQNEMQLTNEKLTHLIGRFERQNRLNDILTEMRDLLHACTTISEIPPIVIGSMKKLFPDTNGALFLLSSSRTDLEAVASWGGFPEDIEDNLFAPDACWGLRRGHAHLVENAEMDPICPHLKHRPDTAYVCLPLIAKGDVLGLLHIRSEQPVQATEKQLITDLKDMAVHVSEYLSLAIANVKLSESLSKQSIQDTLSGLYNRRYMEESLEHEIQRARRNHTQIGVVMADLDHFKAFNDKYGHAAGDVVISHFGRLLRQGTRKTDIACRYGGEEFVLIMPDCSKKDAIKRADDLREATKKLEVFFRGQILDAVSISMGVAVCPDDGIMLDDLLRIADIALYKAKQEGRDRVIGNK